LTTLPKNELALFRKVKEQYDALLEEIPLPAPIVSAAPAATGSAEVDFGDEGAEEEAEYTDLPPAAPTANAVLTAQVAPVPSVNPSPAPRSGSALYLTDKELMESQSRVDDGEVEH
jgi:hypothetical protein